MPTCGIRTTVLCSVHDTIMACGQAKYKPVLTSCTSEIICQTASTILLARRGTPCIRDAWKYQHLFFHRLWSPFFPASALSCTTLPRGEPRRILNRKTATASTTADLVVPAERSGPAVEHPRRKFSAQTAHAQMAVGERKQVLRRLASRILFR